MLIWHPWLSHCVLVAWLIRSSRLHYRTIIGWICLIFSSENNSGHQFLAQIWTAQQRIYSPIFISFYILRSGLFVSSWSLISQSYIVNCEQLLEIQRFTRIWCCLDYTNILPKNRSNQKAIYSNLNLNILLNGS